MLLLPLAVALIPSIIFVQTSCYSEIDKAISIDIRGLDKNSYNTFEAYYSPADISSNADSRKIAKRRESTLKLLQRKLSESGYDARFRPHLLQGRPVFVTCSIEIVIISAVSEASMDFTIDFNLQQSWEDYRLKWDSVDDEHANIAGDNAGFIWKPDSFFPNAKFSSFNEVTMFSGFLRLLPNGHVTAKMRVKLTAYCPMDLRYYPLDHQKCSILVESFSLPVEDLRYNWADEFSDFLPRDAVRFGEDANSLAQFKIIGYRVYETHANRHDGYNHSRLAVEIYFNRNLGYYLIQVYLPAVLMVMSSWISFWLPRNSSPARITLGVTTVLTVVTLSGQTYSAMPKISYLKALDIYLLFCFGVVFLSLLEFAVVSYTMKRTRLQTNKTAASLICAGGKVVSLQPRLSHQMENTGKLQYEPSDDNDRMLLLPCMSHCDGKDTNKPAPRTESRQCVDDNHIWYVTVPSRVECISRILFPSSFVIFNAIYWYYFYFLHHDTAEEEPGFIPYAEHNTKADE